MPAGVKQMNKTAIDFNKPKQFNGPSETDDEKQQKKPTLKVLDLKKLEELSRAKTVKEV